MKPMDFSPMDGLERPQGSGLWDEDPSGAFLSFLTDLGLFETWTPWCGAVSVWLGVDMAEWHGDMVLGSTTFKKQQIFIYICM